MDSRITAIPNGYTITTTCKRCGIEFIYQLHNRPRTCVRYYCPACQRKHDDEYTTTWKQAHPEHYHRRGHSSDLWRCADGYCLNYAACQSLVWTLQPLKCEVA